MIDIFVVLLLQAAGAVPQAPPPAEVKEEVTVTAKTEEAKIVCRMELVTGSRVKKQKVCTAPPNQAQDTQTALQRELSRNGDFIEPQAGFGN